MEFIDWLFALKYKYQTFPLVIQIAIIFIFVSLTGIFVFLISLYFIRRRFNKQEKLEKDLKGKIKKYFEKILFESYHNRPGDIKKNFKKEVGEKPDKEIIDLSIKILIGIKNNSFKPSDNYSLIVRELNMEEHIRNKLKSSKMTAINELSLLKIDSSDADILPYTYSSNADIKNEARLSYLNLSKNDPYRIFDEVKGDVNQWTQIKLINLLIEQKKISGLPNFGKWIVYSENDSLIIFLLKVSGYFDQESVKQIIVKNLLDHKNPEVRQEAFLTLGKLNAVEYEEILKDAYPLQPDNVQTAIVKAIGLLNTGKATEFLEEAYYDAQNITTRKEILLVIYNYGLLGKHLFEKIENQEAKKEINLEKEGFGKEESFEKEGNFDKVIFKHVKNDLILYK